MNSKSKSKPKPRRRRGEKVTLIRAVHERLTSGQFLHLPIHTCGEVEQDLGESVRVRFIPHGEPLHAPTSPLSPRRAGDRVVSVTCVVSRAMVRAVEN